jgi:hypothetical protein
MGKYTRRDILKILVRAYPSLLLGCRKGNDVFNDELVCVHIFNSDISFPEPLLKKYERIPKRKGSLFNIGIPELLVCTTSSSFLNMFQYFWPITRDEFQKINSVISIKGIVSEIRSKEDIEHVATQITSQTNNITSALLFTYNDYTKYWCSDLISFWKDLNIEEFVLFKDPTKFPYLCDFTSLQKGFRRPP